MEAETTALGLFFMVFHVLAQIVLACEFLIADFAFKVVLWEVLLSAGPARMIGADVANHVPLLRRAPPVAEQAERADDGLEMRSHVLFKVPEVVVGFGATRLATVVQSVISLVGFEVWKGLLLKFACVDRTRHFCAGAGVVEAGMCRIDDGAVKLGMVVCLMSGGGAIYMLRRSRRECERLLREVVKAQVLGWNCRCMLTIALKSKVGNRELIQRLIQGQGGNGIHRPGGRGRRGGCREAKVTSVVRRQALRIRVLEAVSLVVLGVYPLISAIGPLDALLHVLNGAAAATTGV